jgi:TolA-binding protein
MVRTFKTLLLAAAVLVSVWMAASYAADRPARSSNSYEVIVGEQKSDMQRMIEAYERLSEQYLVVVQDNLAFMANQDRQILEKLTVLEKKIDALDAKLDTAQKTTAPAKAAAAPEQPTQPDVKY